MKSKQSIIKNNAIALKYVCKFCPMLIVYSTFNVISKVVFSLSKVMLISKAIELVVKKIEFIEILNTLAIYILVMIICTIINVIYDDYILIKYRYVYQKKMQRFIFSKVKNIDMESYDNPEFYDRFSRTTRESVWRGFQTFNIIKNFIVNVSVLIALGTFIIIKDPLLLVLIFICTILNLIFSTIENKIWYQNYKASEKERRYQWYVQRTFYNQRNAAELKTTNVSNVLIDKYEENTKECNKKFKKCYKKSVAPHGALAFTEVILKSAGIYLILMYRLIKGVIDIASFTSLVNAVNEFDSKVAELSNIIANLKKEAMYIEDFIWLLEYQPKDGIRKDFKNIAFQKLSLNDVSFKYPGCKDDTLKNISLSAIKGKRIAIVGHNGSGKTTLMKLLLNFYSVTNGNICLNDCKYDEFDTLEIRDQYAIVFQDFQIYAVTIAENVLMRRVESKEDEQLVWDALENVGLIDKVRNLKDGIYTEVTREFDREGISFSGGERQRLAIARVFASQKNIYILDEPTAALDPLAEARINKLIIEKAKDKTMFIIAHRLSTVVDADIIYLIDNGQIIEQGTHNELMAYNGIYAKMFNTQKHLYEEKINE